MERFQDRVAIVTGGAQGIGEAIARKLAAESAKVAILDIQHEKAQAVAGDISSSGGRAAGVKMDITNSRDIWQAVQDVEAMFGKVDVLINNAGWDKTGPFVELDEEIWDRVIAVNLRGPMTVTRAVMDDRCAGCYHRCRRQGGLGTVLSRVDRGQSRLGMMLARRLVGLKGPAYSLPRRRQT